MRLSGWLSRWWLRVFPPKTLGRRGEEAAARLFKRLGYKILTRRSRRLAPGELDLVAVWMAAQSFSSRSKRKATANVGHPAEAVNAAKQRKLTRLAVTFLKRHGLLEFPARFDVVAITWPAGRGRPTIEHFKMPLKPWGRESFSRNARHPRVKVI